MSFPLLYPAAFAFIAAASVFDLRFRRIPDLLNAGFFVLCLAASLYYGTGVLAQFALFSALSLFFSLLLYRMGAWGGGDAKFFIALSASLAVFGKSLESAVLLFLLSALLLGVAALFSRRSMRFPGLEINLLNALGVRHSERGGRSLSFAPVLSAAFAAMGFFA